MQNIEILCVGGIKEDYFRAATTEYEKRLNAYCKVHTTECKSDAQLLPFLKNHPRSYKVALCVEGIECTSPELAKLLGDCAAQGNGDVIFVIGGSDGLPEEVKAACHKRLSFSRLTFPHRMMRVILAEQLYRAQSILHNGSYHK